MIEKLRQKLIELFPEEVESINLDNEHEVWELTFELLYRLYRWDN